MKWIKMDCDTQENLDMKKLIDEWGWEWYGRYFAILGKIGMLVTDKRQSFALQTNNGDPFPVRLLANDLSTNVERLSNFCKYLADNRLIDKDAWYSKNLIYCPKLAERADEYTKKLLTKSRHSPEQEEEEEVDKKKKKSTDTKSVKTDFVIPDSLNDKEFTTAFENFKQHRQEIKKPLTQRSGNMILKNLSAFSPHIASKMIEQSIMNGWQGVFELKNQSAKTNQKKEEFPSPLALYRLRKANEAHG